jgi:hypothetical protein
MDIWMNTKSYVGFFTGNSWYSWLFKKGFSHCFYILEKENMYYVINPLDGHLQFEIYSSESLDIFYDTLKEHFQDLTLVPYTLNIKSYRSKFFIKPKLNTCVTFIKWALQIKNCRSLTPYQLYKFLEKQK